MSHGFLDMVKVSDYIASFIKSLGVNHVFLLSGGGMMHLLDSIGKTSGLDYICNHHEQASSMAAEAYARVNGHIGVCMVTTGPGGTNAVTGVMGAWTDSIPTLFVSGQVGRVHIPPIGTVRQLGVQEVCITEIVRPITKYAELVLDPQMIKYHLQKAVFLATHARKGPVWLDIPLDVQSAFVDEDELPGFDAHGEGFIEKYNGGEVQEIIQLLKSSRRPLIIAGHGISLSESRNSFMQLISRCNIPVVTSMSGHDVIPTGHQLYVGRPGVFGDRAGNFAVQTCDILLSLGARLHLWNTGYKTALFAQHAKKIIVDVDKNELSKHTIKADIGVCADLKQFIDELLQGLGPDVLDPRKTWNAQCAEWKVKYPVVLPEYAHTKQYVNSYYFISRLSACMAEDEIIFTGNGSAFTCTNQAIRMKGNQRLHYNVGCAAMGYDLPAAIGAAFARTGKRIVLITGDGSIMLNLQELQTIAHHRLPIKIFLLNNNGYLAIKNTQNNYFKGALVGSGPTSGVSFPQFEAIAKAFSIPYVRLDDSGLTDRFITEALESPGSVICDISMDPNQPLIPKFSSELKPDGTFQPHALEDMYPYLPADELTENIHKALLC